jgi:hypothetical protein
MSQSTFDVRPPDLATARAVGEVAAQLATAKAERESPGFVARAEHYVLAKLATGPASGEDITDYVAQFLEFKDGRSMGTVYASMNRRGLIRIVGDCDRRKGHGTGGGHIWERV